MRVRATVKQKAIPFALAFLLAMCLAVIIPVMQARADVNGIRIVGDSDLDQMVDQAAVIEEEGAYDKTAGALISANYPATFDFDFDTQQMYGTVQSGEGYLFRFDLPVNTVATVKCLNSGEPENYEAATLIAYCLDAKAPDFTEYDTTYIREYVTNYAFPYSENDMALVNTDETRAKRCYLFIPKDSITQKVDVSFKEIITTDGYYMVSISDAGLPNVLGDCMDKAMEVEIGKSVDLTQAASFDVTVATKTYSASPYGVYETEKSSAKLIHIKGGSNPDGIQYMCLKDAVNYETYGTEEGSQPEWQNVSMIRQGKSIWVSTDQYILLPADAVFDHWSATEPPIDLTESLDKDKVNVVSWDSDLKSTLNQVFKVYPGLEDKVNYINLGIASGSLDPTRDEIAAGKYNGYTILTVMDVSSYKEADKFPALSEIGLSASDYSESYAYLREMGTFNGELKAVSWHTCPNGFFYNASIAKKVLGTDDPVSVQEMISTPAKFSEVAKQMKTAGYTMTSGVTLTSSEIEYYQENEKKGYFYNQLLELQKVYDVSAYDTGNGIWSDGWYNDLTSGKVFGTFGTNWMRSVYEGSGVPAGTFKLCEGPIP